MPLVRAAPLLVYSLLVEFPVSPRRLPRRYAPRNDVAFSLLVEFPVPPKRLPRRYAPRNDVVYSLLFGFPISPKRLPRRNALRNDVVYSLLVEFPVFLKRLLPTPPYPQALVVATRQSPDYGVLMPEYKSIHCGFILSTKEFFFFRDQDLICFSRSIASIMLPKAS